MRLIPVMDLLEGLAVHAVKGERAHYRPVKSVLSDSPDPLALARAFRDRLGLNEVYVADLNAIENLSPSNHQEVIAALIFAEKMDVILDAGISDVHKAREWLDRGVHKVVIGSETLHSWDALQNIPDSIDKDRLVFSLDLQSGKILSQCHEFAAMTPLDALKHLQLSGWQEVILLDLRRVGTGDGADYTLAAEARARFPELRLLIGGGTAKPEELIKLESAGIAGVLVATALHQGIIGAPFLSTLRAEK